MGRERVAGQQARGLHRDRNLNGPVFEAVPKVACCPKIHDSMGYLGPDSSGLQCLLCQCACRKVRGHQPKDCRAVDHELLRVSDGRPFCGAHEHQRVMGDRVALLFVDVPVGHQGVHPAHVGRHKHMGRGSAICLTQQSFGRVKADAYGPAMRELPASHDRFQYRLERTGGK